jgi:hypothetical protein
MEKKMNAISLRGFWPRGRVLGSRARQKADQVAAADQQAIDDMGSGKDEPGLAIQSLAANNPHILAASLFLRKQK